MLYTDNLAKSVYMRMLNLAKNRIRDSNPIFDEKAKGFRKNLSSEFEKIDFKNWKVTEEEVDALIENFTTEIPKETFKTYENFCLSNIALSKKTFGANALVFIRAAKNPFYQSIRAAIKYVKEHGMHALTSEVMCQLRSEIPFEEYKEYIEIMSEVPKGVIKEKLGKGLEELKKDIGAELSGIGTQVFEAVGKVTDVYIDNVISGINETFLEKIYGKSTAEN